MELKIADIIESYGSPMTLSQLSSTLNCSSSRLFRIFRFLVHRGIFRKETIAENQIGYAHTPLSHLLTTNGENSVTPLFLLETSPMICASWLYLSAHVKNSDTSPFELAHGKDFWSYAAQNQEYNLLFNEAMACSARATTAAILDGCEDLFNGVGSLVDVGEGNGATLNMFVKACPWLRGINFDLPHVVSTSPNYENVQHVGGDMFRSVPKAADVALLKWIVHDWSDEECIKILNNCKEAIPIDGGKVIIIEGIIEEEEENKLSDVGLNLDLLMMICTNKGKERTREEWEYVINSAGFSRYTIAPIQDGTYRTMRDNIIKIMEESKWKKGEEDEAKIQIYKYVFGFADAAIIKCAIELKIADAIESHGRLMTLSQLSSALNCSPPLLYRIMRFLIHRGIFKEETIAENLKGYAQTPLSRMLITTDNKGKHTMSLASLLLLENSPTMVAPWHNLSAKVKAKTSLSPFEVAHGKDVWSYAAANPAFNTLFNEGLACNAKAITLPAILESCGYVFNGVGSLVDVGGGNGTTLSILVKAFPWMKGINFDLPNVVSTSPQYEAVQHVGGSMLDYVPNADAAFFMWILHAWDDEDCIKILKNCKEAIPENTGKVIIIDAVIDEKEESKLLADVRLTLDMLMMTRSQRGKERTAEEWAAVLNKAGFSRLTITPIVGAVPSLIQAFI